jgi:hypothetical protein
MQGAIGPFPAHGAGSAATESADRDRRASCTTLGKSPPLRSWGAASHIDEAIGNPRGIGLVIFHFCHLAWPLRLPNMSTTPCPERADRRFQDEHNEKTAGDAGKGKAAHFLTEQACACLSRHSRAIMFGRPCMGSVLACRQGQLSGMDGRHRWVPRAPACNFQLEALVTERRPAPFVMLWPYSIPLESYMVRPSVRHGKHLYSTYIQYSTNPGRLGAGGDEVRHGRSA